MATARTWITRTWIVYGSNPWYGLKSGIGTLGYRSVEPVQT